MVPITGPGNFCWYFPGYKVACRVRIKNSTKSISKHFRSFEYACSILANGSEQRKGGESFAFLGRVSAVDERANRIHPLTILKVAESGSSHYGT